jgi:lauroyl/myristoyl acyltransferase
MGTGSTKPEALDALRRGELVISPIDLSQSRDNAVVDFFGCPATFPRGLAALAKANHAPLIDLFIYRADGDGLVVEVGEPFIVNDIDAAVQHSASRLEEQIRRHPADWPAWHMFDVWDARDRRSGLASLQHNEPVHVFG